MTFLERYQREDTWYGKVIIIEIFHLAATTHDKTWTVARTAGFFGLSIGLVSENLRLAEGMHRDSNLINAKSRTDALKRIGG